MGIEPVLRLLEQRVHTDGCVHLAATAEALPVNATSFDAITVGSAVHWFDQEPFFAEAARVLRPGGWLAIYDHLFLGEIEGDDSFSRWMRNVHQNMLPALPRAAMFDASTPRPPRFRRLGDDGFVDLIPMSHRQLVDYLLTQSNAIAAVASGRMSLDEVREWLSAETKPFFDGTLATPAFRYWGMVTCFALETIGTPAQRSKVENALLATRLGNVAHGQPVFATVVSTLVDSRQPFQQCDGSKAVHSPPPKRQKLGEPLATAEDEPGNDDGKGDDDRPIRRAQMRGR